MDIGWSGVTRGRVYIRLQPDTGLARQFRQLCTGECGPSYARTRVLGVWNKGTHYEMVAGGDYETNDGHGGAPLIQVRDNTVETMERVFNLLAARGLPVPLSELSTEVVCHNERAKVQFLATHVSFISPYRVSRRVSPTEGEQMQAQ